MPRIQFAPPPCRDFVTPLFPPSEVSQKTSSADEGGAEVTVEGDVARYVRPETAGDEKVNWSDSPLYFKLCVTKISVLVVILVPKMMMTRPRPVLKKNLDCHLLWVIRGLKWFLRIVSRGWDYARMSISLSNLVEKRKSLYGNFCERKFSIFCLGRYIKPSIFLVPRNEFWKTKLK